MKERRIGPDRIVNAISMISIIIWIIFVSVFLLFAFSNPTHAGMSASRPALKGSSSWMKAAIYGLLLFQVLLGSAGLFFNLTRLKRKTDRIRLTLVFSIILGVLGIILMKV